MRVAQFGIRGLFRKEGRVVRCEVGLGTVGMKQIRMHSLCACMAFSKITLVHFESFLIKLGIDGYVLNTIKTTYKENYTILIL